MGRLALAVLLLSFEVVGRAYSASSADAGVARASLMFGAAPPSQVGSGVANGSTCQNGNLTRGLCGGGSPAGITFATTTQNWSQTSTTALTAGTPGNVTLTPCPAGVDYTSGAGYDVYISDGANSEAVAVTSGSTASGICSIRFTPFFSHPVATSYTVKSASSGIQETLNICGGTNSAHPANVQCNMTIPANGPYTSDYTKHSLNDYNIYGTIFLHTNQSILDGSGVSLNCMGRGPCLQIGDTVNANHFANNTVRGISFRSPTDCSAIPAYAGVSITNTVTAANVATITTATAHGFRTGDLVTIMFTDDAGYWGDVYVTGTPTTTSFTYMSTIPILAAQNTPGVVALAYVAILDNANASHLTDIQYDQGNEYGHFNNFFDFWDDENATVDHFNNNGISLRAGTNWTGSFIFSGGAGGHGSAQNAPVITLRDSSITANYSNCATVYNSNGTYIENAVCQASGPWQFYSSNGKGNYQGAYLKNIYSESSIALNPFGTITGSVNSGTFQLGEKLVQSTSGAIAYLHNAVTGSLSMVVSGIVGTPDNSHTWVGQTSSAVYTPTGLPAFKSPLPGLGISGLIAGPTSGAGNFNIMGSGGVAGAFQTGGLGATAYTYFIVANDTTAGTQTSPMQVLNWTSTGSDLIPVHWPRIANGTDTITYDVIRIATPSAIGSVYPYYQGCTGGSGGTCGSVATGLSQATACSGTLVCTYQDMGLSSTSAYTVKLGTYAGNFAFWPGAIVSSTKTVAVDQEMGNAVAVGMFGSPIEVAKQCTGQGQSTSSGYTSCLASVPTLGNGVTNQTAAMLSDGTVTNGGIRLTKGRLNFTYNSNQNLGPHHIITLIDSQPDLTRATIGYRPPASANDVWIGTDVSSAGVGLTLGQLAFGAPVSITNYIGATGDGVHANWLERLTSKQKTFAVPVKISEGNSFTLGDGSPLSEARIYSINNIPASQVRPQSCLDVVGEAKGLAKSVQITSITPPGRLGNLSLNAYPSDQGAIILHFCNPSSSEVITPPGTYSFLAVR
jgi:hypothetical protein